MLARFADRFEFERGLWSRGATRVASVDEAGRGPLAGPVRAAAVILPQVWQALANSKTRSYHFAMIIIRFPDAETERKALGKLVGRFTFRTWDNGETMVPRMALGYLATENITFTVVGPADYERLAPLRNSPAVAV